ncbi:uncharacterized protein [Drosophila bipectinata]|uniref:uncharacterized protein n=1 Tax=Drosophila bipectinata TaxID=42026 RepID=UPI001C8A173B|nr:uncharacterized protein LOC122321032 [Drosophila bipectinata]
MNRFNPMDMDWDDDWEELAEVSSDEPFETVLNRDNQDALRETRSVPIHFMHGTQDGHWHNAFADIDDNESEISDENNMDPAAFINSLGYNPWMRVEGYGLDAPHALRSANFNFREYDDEDGDGYLEIYGDGDSDYNGLSLIGVGSLNRNEFPCNNCMINDAFPHGIFSVPLNEKELARIQTELAEPGEDVVPMATYVKETDDLIAKMLADINGAESKMKTD